jgi:ribosomal protein S25
MDRMPVVMLLLLIKLSLKRSDKTAPTRGDVNLLWIRPVTVEQSLQLDERRVRDFVDSPAGVSESVASLADKLEISHRQCRRILERLVEQGVVQRHDFVDIEPLYVRFPSR